jgi:ATP-dependent DNA ligase
MAEAFAELPTRAAILDGELCLIDAGGAADFRKLMREMRTRAPDETRLMFFVFDLLHQEGVDLRQLPLSERKRDLRRLCRQSRVSFMREMQSFPDGAALLEHCNLMGFEGVVSKRLAARYVSGPSRSWVKVKCEGWKRANQHRAQLFEVPRKPKLSEREIALKKKREELGRVVERLLEPGLRPGIACELRKQQAILEEEIAELDVQG